jgi:Flp pilus assembly protein TadG
MESQRGVSVILVALLLTLMTGLVALAVDEGWRWVSKNQLQNIADAAALAGAGRVGEDYRLLATAAAQQAYVCDAQTVISVVQDVASKNSAGGQHGITINPGDVVIGHWDGDTRILTPTLNQPNGVKVTARRDAQANGPVATYFARIFQETMNVGADATAALSGLGEGEPDAPIGISSYWFERFQQDGYCQQNIQFYPTNTIQGCAGWNTFLEGANANHLKTIIKKLENGSYQVPEIDSGVTSLEFIGGNVAVALKDFQDLFEARRDPATGLWEVLVPVYQSGDCSNPSGSLLIVGFARVYITQVLAPPAGQLVMAQVICDLVEDGRGGGGDYGVFGTIPGLVE